MDDRGAPTPAPRTSLRSKVVMTPSLEGEPSTGSLRHEEDYLRCRLRTRHHSLRMCPVFVGMKPQQRFLLARAHKYCTNCLALSHITAECTSSGRCRVFSLQHHTLLHRQLAARMRTPQCSSTNASSTQIETLPNVGDQGVHHRASSTSDAIPQSPQIENAPFDVPPVGYKLPPIGLKSPASWFMRRCGLYRS
ncbi:PREDICTED: uncharacterized protein LOC108370523 [Rhagoletis zephyria]|uniref:uncharacterized protein LOC108370523 n=1 Tax=Rhagoletis zephyria TaxID=28612 RepID=UPI0008114FCB|nr:PREDICTED: uncharacterized protein LOC108370523 [Rhagoletis zephyria]